MTTDFPKVLIIGEQFDQVRGGGITLTNLFGDWPREKLAVAGFNEPSPETAGKCSAFYLLGKEEFRWPWPFSRLISQSMSGPRLLRSDRGTAAPESPQQRARASRGGLLFSRTMRLAGTDGLWPVAALSGPFLQWVAEQNCDLIYAQVASLQMIEFVAGLARSTGTPLALHQMDDWVPVIYGTGLLGGYSRNLTNSRFKELSGLCELRLSISEAMGESYEQRYGGRWQPFHNPIAIDRFNAVARREWSPGKPFRIWYGGRIGWGNREGVTELCTVIDELRQQGLDVVLEICTMQPPEDFLRRVSSLEGITLAPFVPNAEIPAALSSADLLFLPLDWDQDSLIRAKLSMPTKASEYMASGTPCLVYAPADNALTRYAREGGWAYVVSEHNRATLKAAVVELVQDAPLRERFGRRGMEVASERHDAAKVREKFRELLRRAAGRDRA